VAKRERRRLKRLRALRAAAERRQKDLRRPRTPILSLFAQANSQRYSGRHAIGCPKEFSFIDAPDQAIECLEDFARAALSGVKSLSIQQHECEQIDLCAAAVLNALALEASNRLRLGLKGTYPLQRVPQEIVRAAGLPKCLGLPLTEPEGFHTFKLIKGTRTKAVATAASPKEIQTQHLTEYVNGCLERYDAQLSPQGTDRFGKLVGEILANSEEHSGRGEWWIAGYLRHPKSAPFGDCHLTIFNFGLTLEESLKELPSTSLLRQQIEKLVAEHTRRKLFVVKTWTEENLWTLYALQEGVSRFNDQAQHLGHRGFGTTEMIRMFQLLGQSREPASEPVMCVVSGHTHIRFDNSVRLDLQPTSTGQQRRVIAFNAANDLGQPPERKYVRNLANFFPGTLISLRFYLDKAYLVGAGGEYATRR
jgi:hypothetical protein